MLLREFKGRDSAVRRSRYALLMPSLRLLSLATLMYLPCAKNVGVLADESMYTTGIERWGSSFMGMVKLLVRIVVVDVRGPRFRCEGASVW